MTDSINAVNIEDEDSLRQMADLRRRLYLAGPMRGYPAYNFPAFHAAAAALRAKGCEVWSPAEHDLSTGFDPANDTAKELSCYMERDLAEVCRADAVAVLPGWEKSTGAKLEVHVARVVGKPVLHADTLLPVSTEERQTDAATGGQKGVKLERFDLIPAEPLEELARVYGYGSKKYEAHNWAKGYPWGWSFGALMRHAWAFWRGEDRDPESGLHHLAHAAWHCFNLFWFGLHRQTHDDRLKL